MEIDEFLTRISLSNADPTIFTLYEKGKNVTAKGKELFFDHRTLKTYTKTEDASVVGMINYDKPFPKTIFAMNPEGLKNILNESSNIRIEDTYLIASGNMEFRWKLEVLGNTKSMDFQYERPGIVLTKDVVSKIIRADRILDTNTILFEGDGKNITITMGGKIKSNKIKITLPSTVEPFDALYQERFIECLKLCGEKDVVFNPNGRKPEMPSEVRGPGLLQISDETASITFYITEVTRSVNEERNTKESIGMEINDNEDEDEDEDEESDETEEEIEEEISDDEKGDL